MKKYSFYLYRILISLALVSFQGATWAACFGDKTSARTFSVYVVPQLAASHLYAHWGPFLQELGQRSQQCFELVIPKDIPDFESSLKKGIPDFAYMNPYHQVMSHRSQKYVPLITSEKNQLRGILVVDKDSDIKTLRDLNNTDVAFPAPNAFAASLIIRATLAQAGIKINSKYVRTHENVYRAVAFGDVKAGGGINSTFDREPEQLRNELKILFTTANYKSHPFSAHPRVSAKVRKQVVNAFLEISAIEAGKALLDDIQIPQPVTADYRRDYASLEKLGLEKFVVAGEN